MRRIIPATAVTEFPTPDGPIVVFPGSTEDVTTWSVLTPQLERVYWAKLLLLAADNRHYANAARKIWASVKPTGGVLNKLSLVYGETTVARLMGCSVFRLRRLRRVDSAQLLASELVAVLDKVDIAAVVAEIRLEALLKTLPV